MKCAKIVSKKSTVSSVPTSLLKMTHQPYPVNEQSVQMIYKHTKEILKIVLELTVLNLLLSLGLLFQCKYMSYLLKILL